MDNVIQEKINELMNSKEKMEIFKTENKKIIYNHIQLKVKKHIEYHISNLEINIMLLLYINKHCMYLLYTNIDNKDKYMIIKIGYSYNIIKRLIELKKDYGNVFYPIRIYEVNAESDEVNFHSYMKTNHEKLRYTENEMIKDKSSEELYYGLPIVIDTFDSYASTIKLNYEIEKTKQKKYEKEIEEEKTKQEIEKTKQKNIDKKIETEKTKQELHKVRQRELELEILKLKINTNKIID